MTTTPRAVKLSDEHRALLSPFAVMFGNMGDKVFEMSNHDLARLSEAIENVTETNCSCIIYDAAKWLREQIDDVRRGRAALRAGREREG